MDNLKDVLEKRDHNLKRSVFRFGGDDTIKRSGKECLGSAGSIREAYTASYKPTLASIANRDISEWNRDVVRQSGAEPLRPKDLDAMGQNVLADLHAAKIRMLVRSKDAWDTALGDFNGTHDKAALMQAYKDNAPDK